MRLLVAALCVFAINSLWEDESGTAHDSDEERRKQVAEKYFIEGDISYDEQKLEEALPFHRAAARLYPENLNYVMKAAFDEYQLEEYASAYVHFLMVLKEDPGNAIADFYVRRMKEDFQYCFEDGCPESWDEVSNLQPLKELSAGDVFVQSAEGALEFPTFPEHSVYPFVIRNALQHVGADISVFAVDWLQEMYGEHPVDFYPQNMITKPTKVYNVPFSKALDYLAFPEGAYLSVDASMPGTYIQWNLNETTWDALLARTRLSQLPRVLTHSLDSLFTERSSSKTVELTASGDVTTDTTNTVDPVGDSDDIRAERDSAKHRFTQKTHWYMLLVGEASSGMFAHQDTLAVGSWQAQVAGSKRWRVCSPTSPFEPDVLEPNPPPIGSEEGQVCHETVLHTGDIIYYPPYYWHETKNLETPSMSLSGTVVVDTTVHADVGDNVPAGSGNTYREVLINFLREECNVDSKGFDFDGDVCDFFF